MSTPYNIVDIVNMFPYYEEQCYACPKCGNRPKLYWTETVKPETIIELKCEDDVVTRTISLFELVQVSNNKLYISSVLTDMVRVWNKSILN